MTDYDQHESDDLKAAIHATFKELSGITGGILTHLQLGRGSLLDLYEQFLFHTCVLVELTECLEQMKTSQELVVRINHWIELPGPSTDKDFKERCKMGLRLVKEYKTALVQSGLVVLPIGGK